MAVLNPDIHEAKRVDIMEKCFDCYAEHGFTGVGIKTLANACGLSSGSLYFYFDNLDDLIIQSTEHCMSRVEDDFMARAPKNASELERFINEVPYWTAEKHGKKYRLMYQIYTHPKYREHGQKFFAGVNQRYLRYAELLEAQLGIPRNMLTGLIFILVRTCVHYALFEDEFYLKAQTDVLKQTIQLMLEQYQVIQAPDLTAEFESRLADCGDPAEEKEEIA